MLALTNTLTFDLVPIPNKQSLDLQQTLHQQIVKKLESIFIKCIFIKHALGLYNNTLALKASLSVDKLTICKFKTVNKSILKCPFCENKIYKISNTKLTILNKRIGLAIRISKHDLHLIKEHNFFSARLDKKKIIKVLRIKKNTNYKIETEKYQTLNRIRFTTLPEGKRFQDFLKEELTTVRKDAQYAVINSFQAYLLPYFSLQNKTPDGCLYLHFFSNEVFSDLSFKINRLKFRSSFSDGYSVFEVILNPVLKKTDGIELPQSKSATKGEKKLRAINEDFRLPEEKRNIDLIEFPQHCSLL